MTDDHSKLATALNEAARQLNAHRSVEETLDSIVQAVLDFVPGFDHAGISVVHRNGEVETKAATDQLVWELDALQYELGEGPCVESLRGEDVIAVEHFPHEQRWPGYVSRGARQGLRSQLGFQLYVDDETLGGLNLYSTSSETIAPDAVELAGLFATQAALALGHARDKDQLNDAIATRQLVGQAIGIVMERYGIDTERAFQFLVRASSTSNIKLRVIAEELVEQANDTNREK